MVRNENVKIRSDNLKMHDNNAILQETNKELRQKNEELLKENQDLIQSNLEFHTRQEELKMMTHAQVDLLNRKIMVEGREDYEEDN